jgi:hypothetical protein
MAIGDMEKDKDNIRFTYSNNKVTVNELKEMFDVSDYVLQKFLTENNIRKMHRLGKLERVSKDIIEEVKKLYLVENKNIDEIAKLYNVSHQTLRAFMKDNTIVLKEPKKHHLTEKDKVMKIHNIPNRSSSKILTKDEVVKVTKIKQLYLEENKTALEISEIYNLPLGTVKGFLKRHRILKSVTSKPKPKQEPVNQIPVITKSEPIIIGPKTIRGKTIKKLQVMEDKYMLDITEFVYNKLETLTTQRESLQQNYNKNKETISEKEEVIRSSSFSNRQKDIVKKEIEILHLQNLDIRDESQKLLALIIKNQTVTKFADQYEELLEIITNLFDKPINEIKSTLTIFKNKYKILIEEITKGDE